MILGIAGKMRSGKSTFATFMADLLPSDRASFASPIKRIATEITGKEIKDENKEKIRPLLQAIGETCKALHGQDYLTCENLAALSRTVIRSAFCTWTRMSQSFCNS